MKRIGILTGGGDSSGVNKAIVTIVRALGYRGVETVGIRNGWQGLLEGAWDTLALEACKGWEYQPGTLLGTARVNPFTQGKDKQLLAGIEECKLDGLIAIGGDDTLSVAEKLSALGFPVVGIPQTIDNDVYGTDRCLGFDTALHAIAKNVNAVRNSNAAHARDMLVEVMGRDTGWLAVFSSILVGADYVLCPELDTTIDGLVSRFQARKKAGCPSCLAIVAEGFGLSARGDLEQADVFGNLELEGVAYWVAKQVHEKTKQKPRVLVLGYLQRGGSPTPTDLLLATRFAEGAVSTLLAGQKGIMMALQRDEVVRVPLAEVVGRKQIVPPQWLELAKLELGL